MVIAVLQPTGAVGLVGSGESPQPDSIAASAMLTGIRINIRKLPFLRITHQYDRTVVEMREKPISSIPKPRQGLARFTPFNV